MQLNKIIAIDDDPTGSQTVHSCLLLTRWDTSTLIEALTDDSPLFFILSNTRGMDAARAKALTREICINLKDALNELAAKGTHINPIIVSRSDSTLRGHYPVETDVIAAELGPFDAHFLVPAFFEGGRFTKDSTHYLNVNGSAVPVDQTEFAKDSVFGFSTAYLPAYVEEKTKGLINAEQVERFLLDDVRGDSLQRLLSLKDNTCCVVDSETQADLNHFTAQLHKAASSGKRFLFRSAASLLTAFANLPPQPIKSEQMAYYVRNNQPGVILIGSHVAKTSAQLEHLRKHSDVKPIHIDVRFLNQHSSLQTFEALSALTDSTLKQVNEAHKNGLTVAIYTSREELQFPTQAERLAFGERVSLLLMTIVQNLPRDIGFLISKGGITSNDVLSTGLGLAKSRVLGQILAGCSVVRCPSDHKSFPDLPVVIFPGNVGDESAITKAYQILSAKTSKPSIKQSA